MSVKIKSALILLITLAIGVGLGVQGDRMMMKQKIRERTRRPPDSRLFMRIFDRIIEPTESQREQIRQIIEKHTKRLAKIDSTTRLQFAEELDSLRKDLDPILTEEQRKRIKEHTERIERFGKRRGRMPHPPGKHFPPPDGMMHDGGPPPHPDGMEPNDGPPPKPDGSKPNGPPPPMNYE